MSRIVSPKKDPFEVPSHGWYEMGHFGTPEKGKLCTQPGSDEGAIYQRNFDGTDRASGLLPAKCADEYQGLFSADGGKIVTDQ